MNGCRTLTKTSEFTPIVKIGGGYAVRLASYQISIDGEDFTSAFEVITDHEPTESEIASLEAQATEKLRTAKIAELTERANYAPVKEITWSDGEKFWWSSETRASIRASIEARKKTGGGIYLEINGAIHAMSATEATSVINRIETYASDCHRRYCEMSAEITALETPQTIAEYAFTFPEPVTFAE